MNVSGRPLVVAALAIASLTFGTAHARSAHWESPFQAGQVEMRRDQLVPLVASACDGDPYNKCTFSARVDFDGDGVMDVARMMNGRTVGAIVVEFGGRVKRKPMTIATFVGRWEGNSYIAPVSGDRRAVEFVQPESSMAHLRMRGGRPMIRWIGD